MEADANEREEQIGEFERDKGERESEFTSNIEAAPIHANASLADLQVSAPPSARLFSLQKERLNR